METKPKKYFIAPKTTNIYTGDLTDMNFSLSQILGILSFAATALTFAATYFEQLKPGTAVWFLAASAAISAFTRRIQGTPDTK